MADIIEMTQLSPTMDEGLLVEWLKEEGDTVEVGDLIAEIETDKAAMEMESYFDGTILKILVGKDESVPIGAPLAIMGDPDEDIEDLIQSAKADLEAARNKGAKNNDDADEKKDASNDQEQGGKENRCKDSGGKENGRKEKNRGNDRAEQGHEQSTRLEPQNREGRILASPLARHIAKDHDLPIDQIPGSGPGGRIIERDVREAIENGLPRTTSHAASATQKTETVPLSPMRRSIARNTTAAWEIPAFMLTREIRMDNALQFRAQINTALEAASEDAPKISINDLIIKASALALRDHPNINVAFEGDSVTQYALSRIGIAVAIPDGLITPVVQNAENKGLRDIANEVRELAGRAREKKLQTEEYTNASFSISNLGMFGIDHFTAVLNPPGAAILAIGKSSARLVPADTPNGFESHTMMAVTMTCDHRAIDGAMGAKWLQTLAQYLEQPATMLL